jgi:hypothetical protein
MKKERGEILKDSKKSKQIKQRNWRKIRLYTVWKKARKEIYERKL